MSKRIGSDTIEAPDLNEAQTKSGRAVWDNHGNSSWEWQTQPGVYSADIDTQTLRMLQAPLLKLVEHTETAAGMQPQAYRSEPLPPMSSSRRHAEQSPAVLAASYSPRVRRGS